MIGEEFYRPRPGSDIRLVSIQSAKGGVGKTMVAFLLAEHLRLQGVNNEPARVAVLDLDFTGTSVIDALVAEERSGPRTGTFRLHDVPIRVLFDRDKPVTLLGLFKAHLEGRNLAEQLTFHLLQGIWNKDRVIATERAARTAANHGGAAHERAIQSRVLHITSGGTSDTEAPGLSKGWGGLFANVLFDANHAAWFVDLLFDLFDQLQVNMRDQMASDHHGSPPSMPPLYIILDNAPGQSELLPVLQEKMLRWGRHRAKFVQVASLDEMDLRASLTVLSQLDDQSTLIHHTKDAITTDLRPVRDRKKVWADLFAELDRGTLDRDLFDEVVSEDSATLQAISDNVEQEAKARSYMALILNRVSETVDLSLVDRYILDQAGRLSPRTNSSKRQLLTDLARHALPFDSALALFFQERFQLRLIGPEDGPQPTQVPGTEDQTDAAPQAGILGTARNSPTQDAGEVDAQAVPPNSYHPDGEVSWDELAQFDVDLYQALFSATTMLDASVLERDLVRGIGPRDVSHLLRGFDVLGHLLDVADRIVTACCQPLPSARAGRTSFRFAATRALEDQLRLATHGHHAGPQVLETLGKLTFADACLRGRQKALEGIDSPVLQQASLESADRVIEDIDDFIEARAKHLTDFERQAPTPLLRAMLARTYRLYLIYTAFPTGLDRHTSQLTPEYRELGRAIGRVAATILVGATGQMSTSDICTEVMTQLSTLAFHSTPEHVHRFHLEVDAVTESTALYDRSLEHAASSSRLMLKLVDALQHGQFDRVPLTGIAALYIRTCLVELFHGVRSDDDEVWTELTSLLEHGARGVLTPRLTRRIRVRLGRILDTLFVASESHVTA